MVISGPMATVLSEAGAGAGTGAATGAGMDAAAGAGAGTGAPPLSSAATARRAEDISEPRWNLRSGFLASPLSRTAFSEAGRPALTVVMSGWGSLAIWKRSVPSPSPPLKGFSPATSSKRATERENRSERPSTFLPATCSGLM